MKLITEPYPAQQSRWPQTGRHILAQFDSESVVVYQAYRPEIGHYAAAHGHFGHGFSLSRMSWIKTNFLWMMYRSGWGTKENQEVVLAIRLKRPAFNFILAEAVHSSYVPEVYGSREAWQQKLHDSPVRLQWDPDHDPSGARQERRAIQLGLCNDILRQYVSEWTIDIQDISEFVKQQYRHVAFHHYDSLLTPQEYPYPVQDGETANKLGLSPPVI